MAGLVRARWQKHLKFRPLAIGRRAFFLQESFDLFRYRGKIVPGFADDVFGDNRARGLAQRTGLNLLGIVGDLSILDFYGDGDAAAANPAGFGDAYYRIIHAPIRRQAGCQAQDLFVVQGIHNVNVIL